MKNLKLFVLAIGLFTINLSAANLHPINPTDELRIEIVDLIGSDYMDEMLADQDQADVLFTVNSNKELIILLQIQITSLKEFLKLIEERVQ